MSAYRDARQAPLAPPRCEVTLAELPAESQEKLLALARAERDPRKLRRDAHMTAIIAIVVGAMAAAILALMTTEGTAEPTREDQFAAGGGWPAAELALVVGASFLVGLLFFGGILVLARGLRSPLGAFWYAHSAYLLACNHRSLTAYPLVRLSDYRIHDCTVELVFDGEGERLVFETPAEAARFMEVVTQDAANAAPHATQIDPEAIAGAGLIPAELLHRKRLLTFWQRDWGIPFAVGIAFAIAGGITLPPLHAAFLEPRLFAACMANNAICRTYLQTFPDGPHRDEADDFVFAQVVDPIDYQAYRRLLPNGRHITRRNEQTKPATPPPEE